MCFKNNSQKLNFYIYIAHRYRTRLQTAVHNMHQAVNLVYSSLSTLVRLFLGFINPQLYHILS